MPIDKRWEVKAQGDPSAVAQIATQTGISPVLANLLVQRGIDTVEKAKRFFDPQLANLHLILFCLRSWNGQGYCTRILTICINIWIITMYQIS